MILGIIGAMNIEVESLKKAMTDLEIKNIASIAFYTGRLNECDVVIAQSGIGKVNAACCAQIMVSVFGVSHLINTGIAGSLMAEINICDIVLATDAVEHDVDARGFGYEPGQIPQMKEFSFVADEYMRKTAKEACKKVNSGVQVFEGRVVSGDQFVSEKEKKIWLYDTFEGYCTEMEGAAIAHTASLNKIPFLIVRAISDKADDSANMDYKEFEIQAAENSVRLLLELTKIFARRQNV